MAEPSQAEEPAAWLRPVPVDSAALAPRPGGGGAALSPAALPQAESAAVCLGALPPGATVAVMLVALLAGMLLRQVSPAASARGSRQLRQAGAPAAASGDDRSRPRHAHPAAPASASRAAPPTGAPGAAAAEEPSFKPAALRRLAAPGGGTLVVTFANQYALQMVLNWDAHLQRSGLAGRLVAATDDALLGELRRRGVAAARMRSVMPRQEAKWGSRGFMAMGRTKGALVATVLAAGVDVLFVDADCVVLRNPLPYLQGLGADILMHSDALYASRAPSDGLEDPSRSLPADLNTGFFWVRSTGATRAAVREWERIMADDRFFGNWRNDQTAYNRVMKQGARTAGAGPIVMAANGTVRLGILPVHLFCSGHTFFVQRLPQRLRVQPFAVHVTFVSCDAPGKRHRMREAGLWLVDGEEYYAPQGGLLLYDADVPAEMLRGFAVRADGRPVAVGDEIVARHFRLVHHQLRQLRTGLALAAAANRTLVLPRLLCGLETSPNFAHAGLRCPSCGPRLPYLCPADHVLRLHYWAGSPPFGPPPRLQLPFREFSLLDRTDGRRGAAAAAALRGRVRIDTGAPAAPCELPAAAAEQGGSGYPSEDPSVAQRAACGAPTRARLAAQPPSATVRLSAPGGVVSRQSLQQLQAHRGAPLWHFGSLAGLAVELGAMQGAFEETTKWLPGGWCCAAPKPAGKGHYFYDMWWDTLPHTDRWGRSFNATEGFRLLPGP
eukprot:TRINITY_DN10737_c0_g1_i1.p1 TRINITY_DN10737_c0_g1~~TRINITY_DN10737_c0_g1_i1.p1  ORF type:complete len:749 (+),score=210.62 TRINITY_DN10737_c0_g1_i1:80-2248(+)